LPQRSGLNRNSFRSALILADRRRRSLARFASALPMDWENYFLAGQLVRLPHNILTCSFNLFPPANLLAVEAEADIAITLDHPKTGPAYCQKAYRLHPQRLWRRKLSEALGINQETGRSRRPPLSSTHVEDFVYSRALDYASALEKS